MQIKTEKAAKMQWKESEYQRVRAKAKRTYYLSYVLTL